MRQMNFRFAVLLVLSLGSRGGLVAKVSAAAEGEPERRRCCGTKRTLTSSPLPSLEEVRAADTVPRISCHDISRSDFERDYEAKRQVVVLEGCAKDWKAKETWTLDTDFTARFPPQARVQAALSPTRNKEITTWGNITEALISQSYFYVFDAMNLDADVSQLLQSEFEVPAVFDVDLYEPLEDFPQGYGPRQWLAMGAAGSGTDVHLDPSATDAWNTLIKGYKWWIIFPNTRSHQHLQDLRCDEECSVTENRTVADWYETVPLDGSNKSNDSNDYYGKAIHILQKPGETIYLPQGMLHAAYNPVPSMAITRNYASPVNLGGLWRSVVTEGTTEHVRTFYIHSLNAKQRAWLHDYQLVHPQRHLGISFQPTLWAMDQVLELAENYGWMVTLLFLGSLVGLIALLFFGVYQTRKSASGGGSAHQQSARRVVRVRRVIKAG